ncbi:MAG TPA: hypothetical protein VGC09_18980 [Rhodopila sp.]
MMRDALAPGLAAALLVACTTSPPPDTPVARLRADLQALKAFPSAPISRPCSNALQELTATMNAVTALRQSGKPIDPVTGDVLQSDQSEAETACHPDAVRVCQAPDSPAAMEVCRHVKR